jgi:MFS family permease
MVFRPSLENVSIHSIVTVLICAILLLAGNGLFQTLLPLRADQEAYSTTLIGILGTAYFGGFAIGCFFGPRLIMSVGHVRSFAGAAAILTALCLAFPIILDPYVWSILRVLTGMCLAALFIVVESWLNDRSSNQNRGRILSAYIIVTNIATMAGQLMVNLYSTRESVLFMIVAILVCLSIVPLALTPTVTPKPIPSATLNLKRLYRISPVGAVGCLLVGAVEGAFWSLAPVFAQERGMAISQVTLLMAAFVLGGTLSQWPLGWASDKMDRRFVIAGLASGTVVTGLVIGFVDLPPGWVMFAVALAHGALMVPLYAMCLSHANDNAPNELMVETSGGLLLAYSVGATIGPVAAAVIMEGDNSGGLFVFIAAVLLALAFFVVYRLLTSPLSQRGERVDFIPVPKTSPSVYSLEIDD